MDNPATPADLVNRGYTGTASQTVQKTRLDEAWRALQREKELPGLVARIESGELSPNDVIDVVCAAAMRVLRNPEGVENESGGIDDYREAWKYANASEDLYFTAAEIRRLKADAPAPTAGSFKYS